MCASGVGNQPLGQRPVYGTSIQRGWLAHRLHNSGALHRREKILARVDGLGETEELGAMAEELRAHGDDRVEAPRSGPGKTDAEPGQEGCLFAARAC